MSQVKLSLQAPPNVDFVQGYPGIPPGPDRPQATVQGALEVRTPQGIKAKWVTIELRKVETLPGGGVANTFYDSVPGPVKLWSANAEPEYEVLHSQDFAFNIRIPESTPSTLNLDSRGAGIKYELIGSVCLKGSKGFLRRRKEVVSSTTAPIIINKHELHSTWPVYCQHELRQASDDGISLTVLRDRTCFGPGCIITTVAKLKSDRLNTTILRGYEMALVETMVLTTAHSSTKRAVQQRQEIIVAECKLPVNVTLHGGSQHQAELRCAIPPNQNNSTVNSARHIDITYTLSIKAHLSTGAQVAIRLPVVVSRWPREYSAEAVKLIGPAPGLSLIPITNNPVRQTIDIHPGALSVTPASGQAPHTYAGRPTPAQQSDLSLGPGGTFTAPLSHSASNMRVDEFGRAGPQIPTVEPSSIRGQGAPRSSVYQAEDFPRPNSVTQSSSDASGPGIGRRPPSARPGSSTNRFTITNALPSEIPTDDEPTQQRNNYVSVAPEATRKKPTRAWPTAEEEKKILYEQAKAQVEKTQGSVARVATPPPQTVSHPPEPTSEPRKWPTAEEEKRLYQEAQAAVQRVQFSPPPVHTRSDSKGDSSASKAMSPAALLYSQAMSSRNKSSSPATSPQTSPTIAPINTPSPVKAPSMKSIPHMSAEEEKAALRRYHEAKEAVDRTQNYLASPQAQSSILKNDTVAANPIAYESLYPTGSSSQPLADDLPPSFDASISGSNNILSEKERLRRNYEAQDAATRSQRSGSQRRNGITHPPPPKSESPPPFAVAQDPISQAISEKERMRRYYEQQDALAAANDNNAPPYADMTSSSRHAPMPPPRTNGSSARSRPPPRPPGNPSASTSRPLTAAEEKALLRAKFDAEDNTASLRSESPQSQFTHPSSSPPPPSSSPPPPAGSASTIIPPPLMPRPPLEYIQETREEDARVSRIAGNGILPLLDEPPLLLPLPGTTTASARTPSMNGSVALDMRPFTPFSSSFDSGGVKIPGPPPPLPPKPAGE